ncbi:MULTISPECIES: lipid II:glycine glycyltransferase FemX [unclassified Nocardioides]|uniref:lipid II:glycine glycyltransferase FemX n=1 Tax=Nocardioides sp. URHA0032 TaxID=1380388 RepID=UPI00048D00C5|nr:peptidoglycan bridge formation glycyltransferase FemA/FemB family protein [Nocardioides sp. URHA0032]
MPRPELSVREISASDHLEHIRARRSVSFLQTPAWGRVKSEWRHESIGFFRGGELTGVGLVLYRQLPRLKRYLAYLPEGPDLDWDDEDLAAWLAPMAAYLKERGAFGVRMGPPVVTRRWDAATVKEGIADDAVRRLGELAPTERSSAGARVVSQLTELGWRPQAAEGGFAAGQPQYVFQVPLSGRTEDDVLAGMNQQWRRNIKKAAKEGVETAAYAGVAIEPELKSFHDLYVHTAERDHFTPRPLSYFTTMVKALAAEDPDRIVLHTARHEGTLVAATIAIRVGAHAWYSYGASSTEKREVRGSNAVQWAMIRAAIAAGADVYDLRGITDTLASDDPHLGLIQFKVGTGGEAVEYVGEWDLPLSKPLYRAFDLYMRRRG